MRRERRERFPHHQLQRKPLVSDPGMHHGTCVTHVPWCMSGSLNRGGGENVPGIPGACATRNFTYLARGPWWHQIYVQSCFTVTWGILGFPWYQQVNMWKKNYCDVIMGAIASQIISLASVYSIVYSEANQRKHQSSASLAFVRGIHRWPLNSPHKWPVTRKMFSFQGVIMKRVNPSRNFLKNDDVITTKQNTTKLCSYCVRNMAPHRLTKT